MAPNNQEASEFGKLKEEKPDHYLYSPFPLNGSYFCFCETKACFVCKNKFQTVIETVANFNLVPQTIYETKLAVSEK